MFPNGTKSQALEVEEVLEIPDVVYSIKAMRDGIVDTKMEDFEDKINANEHLFEPA